MTRRLFLPCSGMALTLAIWAGTAVGQEIRLDPPQAQTPLPQVQAPVADRAFDTAGSVRDSAPAQPGSPALPLTLLAVRPSVPLPRTVSMGASLSEPGILRLTGELASIELGLDLPLDHQAPKLLQLALRSAINVLPETAALFVGVNGGAPVELPLDHFGEFHIVEIPAEGLQPGSNRITLSLRQPHRVFCGPEASFGVWTEVDLTRSGAQIPAAALAPDASSFALLLTSQVGAGRPLTVLAELAHDPAAIRQVTDALGAAMQGRGFVDVRSFYDTAPGRGASVAVVASDTNRISYRRNGHGGLTMLVEHAEGTMPDLGDVLSSLALATEAPVAMLTPGQARSLADLSADDIVGNTHYFRHDLRVRLPDNWLLLANQKARLDLQYGYGRDLPDGSILLVKVNDQTVRLLPLVREGGRVLEPLAISFGTQLLHAGVNTLSFEMMVPGSPADAACAPRATDMLVVTKESTLLVPHAPAMQWSGSFPTLAGLTRERITTDPRATDQLRLERAAMQLAAGLAPAEFPDDATSLTLLDFTTGLPPASGLSARDLQAVLFPDRAHTPEMAAAVAMPRFRLSEAAAGDQQTPLPAAGTHVSAGRDASPGSWMERQRKRLQKAMFLSSGESLQNWMRGRKGDALLVPIDPDAPQALGLVLGPGAHLEGISHALDGLREQRVGMAGAALLSNDGSWQVWLPVQAPRLLEPLTPLNMSAVLGNYASWSPLLFTALLLGVGLVSVIPALAIIIAFRARRLR